MTQAPTASERDARTARTFPRFPSWEALRELAALRAEQATCLSLYLSLSPQETATVPDLAKRINSLLDEAAKQAAAVELDHGQRLDLDGALLRARAWLESFDRGQAAAQGLALFASAASPLQAFLLAEPVSDASAVAPSFHLSPLLLEAGREHEALVVQIGREDGVVYLLRHGGLHQLEDLTEWVHGRHDQGGWSQARYERSITNDVRGHLKEVAQALAQLSRQERRPIALLGPEEAKSETSRQLDASDGSLAELVAGWGPAERHADAEALLAAAQPLLDGWWAGEERRLLDGWQEAVATGGRGLAGWDELGPAASDGRVELLLRATPPDHRPVSTPTARECPRCGRVDLSAKVCPLDGTTTAPLADALDGVMREVLRYGGQIMAVCHDDRLAEVAGVGALLRY